jgi:anti-sigma B factor antagonist
MDKPGVIALAQQPIRDHPDAILVTIEGSIDPKTMNQFRDPLQALLAGGKKKFFLDCTRLTYINSSGLAYLLNVVGTVKPKGGSVVLAAVDPKILVIFKMMGITELFQFFPSFKEALRDLDVKLAQELSDVGPALKLEDPPRPAPPTPRPATTAPARKPGSRTDRITKSYRPPAPAPSGNPISQFFRWLFGGSETRRRSFSPMRRSRR